MDAAANPGDEVAACWDQEGFSPGGPGAGLSGYSDALVPASVCTTKELMRAAALGELYHLGGIPSEYFEGEVLHAPDHPGMAAAGAQGVAVPHLLRGSG